MRCSYACGSAEHHLSRRGFLGGVAAGALGFGAMVQPAAARQLEKAHKRVLLVWLSGGSSQLETWDPKPGTDTGGPFQAIAHLGARRPHLRIAAVHRQADAPHGPGPRHQHRRGRSRQGHHHHAHRPATRAGAVNTRTSGRSWPSCWAPRTIRCRATSTSRPGPAAVSTQDAAFLGPQYASRRAGRRQAARQLDAARRPQRRRSTGSGTMSASTRNDRFLRSRRTAETEAYTHSYDQAAQLMQQRDLFDISARADAAARPLRHARLRPALPAGPPAARRRASPSSR